MRIQICSNKGAGLFLGANKGQNMENFDKSSKIFFSGTNGWNALIFGIEHHLGKEIQICSNEVPTVMYGLVPGD